MATTSAPSHQLGAALRFFQCGSDIEIEGTGEAFRRLARMLDDAAERAAGERLIVRYVDPDGRADAKIRLENVAEMTGHAPAAGNWVVPAMSVAGVLWLVILPVTGLVALIWLVVNAIS